MARNFVLAILLSVALARLGEIRALAADPAGSGTAEPTETGQQSLAEVSKQLNNPVADLWSLNFQFNRYYLNGRVTDRTREQALLNFQPVLPVHLTENWNLINRPVLLPSFSTRPPSSREKAGTTSPGSATLRWFLSFRRPSSRAG